MVKWVFSMFLVIIVPYYNVRIFTVIVLSIGKVNVLFEWKIMTVISVGCGLYCNCLVQGRGAIEEW